MHEQKKVASDALIILLSALKAFLILFVYPGKQVAFNKELESKIKIEDIQMYQGCSILLHFDLSQVTSGIALCHVIFLTQVAM